MANLSPYVFMQELDDNGSPLAGGLVYTYEAGTTTAKATYTTSSGLVTNANPVVLDASGRAAIWLGDGGYKFVLKTSAGVTIKTIDDVGGSSSTAFGADVIAVSTNTPITSVHQNAALACTSSPTLSLLPVSSAGEGFYFIVKNAGSGIVTIDPDASETIDGSASITVNAGRSCIVICDAAKWYSLFDNSLANLSLTGTTSVQRLTASDVSSLATTSISSLSVGAMTGTTSMQRLSVSEYTGLTTTNITALTATSINAASITGVASYGRIKALINFNGTSTPTARGTPYNVTSITDNGTGNYTLNLTTALADTNGIVLVTGMSTSGNVGYWCGGQITGVSTVLVTTGIVSDAVYLATDYEFIHVAVFA